MMLRAGDRYLFHGLEGDPDPLAGRLEITLVCATHDGQVVHRVTFPDGMGDVERAMSVSDVARMIELGIWEPLPAALELDRRDDRAQAVARTALDAAGVPALLAERQTVRELHRGEPVMLCAGTTIPCNENHLRCEECGEAWPCNTARVVYTAEEIAAAMQ